MDDYLLIEQIIASSSSIARRRPLNGVGINDVNFVTKTRLSDGKIIRHEGYQAWRGIISRSFCEKYKNKRPTYLDVTTCSNWILFSNFNSWWKVNHVNGWHLDKDLLIPGNRIYRPEACIYVPLWLNCLTNENKSSRGIYPIGVSKSTDNRYFFASVSYDGVQKVVGIFSNPEKAYKCWMDKKIEYIYGMKDKIDGIDKRLFGNIISIIRSQR